MTRLLVLVAALVGALGVLWFTPSDHYLLLPDPADPVDPLVEVPDERETVEEGGIYYLVAIVRRASLAERLIPPLRGDGTLVPEEAINPFGVSETDRKQESLNEMSLSQKIAVAVALRKLDYDVEVTPTGVTASVVIPDSPAAGKLAVGDLIVRLNGRAITRERELRSIMADVRPGADVELVVERDGDRKELTLTTEAERDAQGRERAVIGIVPEQAAEIDLPLDIRIDAGDIGGPSAGLAFALNVVDELGQELDHGRRVAVTGELDLEGNVQPVGGLRQKTIGAREADADLMLVPTANAAEARRYADGLRIVPVDSFEEALSALAPA